jgi:glycosyltransferase involved in cell wall biosynthesis
VATVAHYTERWLELSAGFVATHVERSRHRPVVISRDGWLNLDTFGQRPRHTIAPLRRRTPEPLKAAELKAYLRTLLIACGIDLVHVHFGYAANDVVGVTRDRPYVLSLHGHDVTGLLAGDPGRYRRVAAAVDAVIVPSRFLRDAAAAAGFAADRVHVIPSGVDTAFFTPVEPPAGPPVVAFVGRLVEKKGIDTLLAAWPSIVAGVPEAELHVVGDGPLRQRVEDAVTDRGDVRYDAPDARRPREQVRDLLRRAAVVVTPSHVGADGDSESLLLVNLEAAACGRPVVSSRHGGIPEYVEDGITGVLVEPADATTFAAAVVALLRDPPRAAALGAAARNRVGQWDVGGCTARVDDLYDELLRPRRDRK